MGPRMPPSIRTGDLSLGKKAILRDLGHVAVVPLDYFNTAVLPPLHTCIDIQDIENRLCRSKTSSKESYRWSSFPKDPEKEANLIFGRLSRVFDKVVQLAAEGTGTSPKLTFAQKPTISPTSERANISPPDAYLLLVNTKSVGKYATCSAHRWDDIAVSFELKCDGELGDEYSDNEENMIWHLHHIMCSDPCRRSTFGVTVKNTQMRLWFTCRSVTVVSEPFSFIMLSTQMIRLFCSLAFANDHELGWDPTIQRVFVGGKTQYDISLQSQEGSISVYRTTRVISDFGFEALRGPATRIFEAYLKPDALAGSLLDHPAHVVIKDSWRESSRKREDEIRAEILSDLEQAKGIEAAAVDMKYFLTIREAVDVTVDGKIDDTHQLLRSSPLPDNCVWRQISASPALSQTCHTLSVGYPPSDISGPDVPKPTGIHHRTHSRVVFAEVCTPLFEVRNLDDAFKMLQDALKGLRVLHSIKWVHRDISPSNILCIGGMGKIADLEYAKRMGSNQGHEVHPGMVHFIACEVAVQKYLFHQLSGTKLPEFQLCEVVSRAKSPKVPFTCNPLHDLESLWWIQVWLLHFYVDQEGQERSTEQLVQYQSLFPGVSGSRLIPLESPLVSIILPEGFRQPAKIVEEMRRVLLQAYVLCEYSLPPKLDDHLHKFTTFFANALEGAATVSRNVMLYEPGKYKEPRQEESRRKKRSKVSKMM